MKKLIVLSLGGSLIVPEEIDVKYLKSFKKLILNQLRRGHRFIIVTGGGRTARRYQGALKQISVVSNDELDWMGIGATKINALLIRLVFGQLSHSEVSEKHSRKLNFKEKILLGAGFGAGHSSDYDAVELAETYGSQTVINLSNIDYVYTKDPRKFKDAKKIERISWNEYLKMVGSKWVPGSNFPFDPVAAKLAKKHGQTVIIVNGKNLNNLQRIFAGKSFKGTVIS